LSLVITVLMSPIPKSFNTFISKTMCSTNESEKEKKVIQNN
jgi:hypothetical protein